MPNYCEDFGISVLGEERIIQSRAEFCFTGACMPGRASNMSDTTKSITHLPFLLVETSTGQSFCVVIKLYLEALWLCLWFLVRKYNSLICLCMWFLIFLVAAPLSVFCVLLSALKELDFHNHRFFFLPYYVRIVE